MKASPHFLVDANILLRFLTGEPVIQAAAARKLFTRAEAGELTLEVLPLVVAEAYYVLLSYYGVERKEAASKLALLLQMRGVRLRESTQVLGALQRLQTSNVDFADAYLAAMAVEEKISVASFDKDFNKFREVNRYEPLP